jgi:hypothetical protein
MKLKLFELLIVMLVVPTHNLFAQKVKIEKGEIFVDGVQKGFVMGDN